MEYEGGSTNVNSDEAAISDAYQEEEYEAEDDHEWYETENDAAEGNRYEVAYQCSRNMPRKPLEKVFNHFENTGATVDVSIQKVWRYFPHYSSKKLTDGVLWDILEMQGKHKMWYIGSSVSFESLKSVVEYNKLLLSLMKPISK